MAYKQPSSGLPFKELGSSPARQVDPLDLGLLDEAKSFDKKHKAFKDFDKWHKTLGQTPSNISNKKSMPPNFNIKGSSAEGPITADKYKAKVSTKQPSTFSRTVKTFQNTPKQFAKTGGKILKKGLKFLGGKTLGVAGMMMAKTSKADQPKFKKGDVHYQDPKKKIDFTSGE